MTFRFYAVRIGVPLAVFAALGLALVPAVRRVRDEAHRLADT